MTAQLKRLLATSTVAVAVASMAFTGAAEATVVTPEVVKPQVVAPHVTTAAPAPSPAPAPAAAPSEPQAAGAPAPSAAPSPSSPAELPPPRQGPSDPKHNRGPVGYTCPTSLQCEKRHEEEEAAERSRLSFEANDLRFWGMIIQGVPYAVVVAMQGSITNPWPAPAVTASLGGAASEVRDQLAALVAGGLTLLKELLRKAS